MSLDRVRQKYPEFAALNDKELADRLYESHYSKMPRAEYNKRLGLPTEPESQGFSGIESDISNSAAGLPNAISNMITSIPGGIKNVGKYALSHNPVETLGNLGAGGVEGAAGLLSGPQKGAQYLGEKFPAFGNWMQKNAISPTSNYKSPTLYEQLMKFEKEHGLAARGKEEGSVRNLGGLFYGGKYMSKVGSPAGNIASLASETAGRGGDPLQAALMGIGGHFIAKAPWKKAVTAPIETIKKTPEMLMKAGASGAETAADVMGKLHIPFSQPTLRAISAYLEHKAVSPEKFARRQVFGDIEPEELPLANERMAAARRMGLSHFTPAEATLSPIAAEVEAEFGRTKPGRKLLFKKGRERLESEKKFINDTLDMIHNEDELAPEMKEAYEKTMTRNVPPEFMEKHSKDPVIQLAMEQLHNDAVYRKSLGIPKKTAGTDLTPQPSFRYWDHVKRILGDMEESNKSGEGRKPFKKSVIADTRRAMVSEMDKIEPEYKHARSISEREHTRKKFESHFDKRKMTGSNAFKYLESQKKFTELLGKLKAFPEIQSRIKDMRFIFGDLINHHLNIKAASALKKSGMSGPRNKLDALIQRLDDKYGREHDVAAVELMTDPEWIKEYMKDMGK